jgi:hypothetical protein
VTVRSRKNSGSFTFLRQNGAEHSKKMAGAFISLTKWREFYISAAKMAPRVLKKMAEVLNFFSKFAGVLQFLKQWQEFYIA